VQEEFRSRAERLWSQWLKSQTVHGAREVRVADEPVPASGRSEVRGLASENLAAGAPSVGTEGSELGSEGARGAECNRQASGPEGREVLHTEKGSGAGLGFESHWLRTRSAEAPVRQVVDPVRFAVTKGGDKVTVQLQPESLGRVHVELAREAGGVSAHFRVESPQAQQALSTDLALLRQALEEKGVPLVQVHVELDQRGDREREAWLRAGTPRRRRGAREDELQEIDEIALRPTPWRPWGFEARI
jgi:flagellar hook-length control protein FliK